MLFVKLFVKIFVKFTLVNIFVKFTFSPEKSRKIVEVWWRLLPRRTGIRLSRVGLLGCTWTVMENLYISDYLGIAKTLVSG